MSKSLRLRTNERTQRRPIQRQHPPHLMGTAPHLHDPIRTPLHGHRQSPRESRMHRCRLRHCTQHHQDHLPAQRLHLQRTQRRSHRRSQSLRDLQLSRTCHPALHPPGPIHLQGHESSSRQDLQIAPHRRTPGTQSHPERTGKRTGERKLSKDIVTNSNYPCIYRGVYSNIQG